MGRWENGHPAIGYGVVIGLLLGVLGIGVAVEHWLTGSLVGSVSMVGDGLSLKTSDSGAPLAWDCANYLALLALTGVAGALASLRTVRVRSGAAAGAIAGGLGAMISGVAGFTAVFDHALSALNPAQAASFASMQGMQTVGFTTSLVVVGMGTLGALSGLTMGSIGGLIGAHRRMTARPFGGVPTAPNQLYPPSSFPPA